MTKRSTTSRAVRFVERLRPRGRLKPRHMLPLALIGFVTAGGFFMSGAGAQQPAASSTSYGSVPGTPGSPISFTLPHLSAKEMAQGELLYNANCASCHGFDGTGAASNSGAPNLIDLGAASIDFWVSTGRMPLQNPSALTFRKPLRFTTQEVDEIVAYANSLSGDICTQKGGEYCPAIPHVDLSQASVSQGNLLFDVNCASCHTITGSGDALSDNAYAPSLHQATPTQVAEALLTGPANMPTFGTDLTDQQMADLVAYVTGPIQHQDNAGGVGLGGVGPVAEGFIALLIGVGGIMLIAFWLGDRSPEEEA